MKITFTGGSTKEFAMAARKVVATGGDLYEWLFNEAPVGWVTFTTEHTLPGEFAEGSVRMVHVKGKRVRRASVDLRRAYQLVTA